jgi:hypothetical protein
MQPLLSVVENDEGRRTSPTELCIAFPFKAEGKWKGVRFQTLLESTMEANNDDHKEKNNSKNKEQASITSNTVV